VHVPFAEHAAFEIAEVVEAEEGMVARASEVATVRRAFCLPKVSLTELSRSRIIVFIGMHCLSRSIHLPERATKAVLFSGSVRISVSNLPIWLVEAAK
jgi:hypothetical protein